MKSFLSSLDPLQIIERSIEICTHVRVPHVHGHGHVKEVHENVSSYSSVEQSRMTMMNPAHGSGSGSDDPRIE